MANRTQVIVPTAINVVTLVQDSILASRRVGQEATVSLPTLRARARLIVGGIGSLHVTADDTVVDPATFTR